MISDHLWKLIEALPTTLVAVIVAYIAGKQWQTAKQKLILDLFDKRYASYQRIRAAAEAFWEITGPNLDVSGDFVQNRLREFWAAKNEAYFLFGSDVDAVLIRLESAFRDKIGDIVFMSEPMPPPEKIALAKKLQDDHMTILNLQGELFNVCKKYMSLGHVFIRRRSTFTT